MKALGRFALLTASLLALASTASAQLSDEDDDGFSAVPDYVEVQTYLDRDVYHAGGTATAVLELEMHPTVHINGHVPTVDYQYPTDIDWGELPAGLSLGDITWPHTELKAFEFTDGDKIAVLEGTAYILVPIKVAPGTNLGGHKVTGTFRAQGCTDSVCYAPQKDPFKFTVRVVASDEDSETINEEVFTAARAAPTETHGEEPAGHVEQVAAHLNEDAEVAGDCGDFGTTPADDQPLWIMFGLAFVAGLGLTLTPCVLPLVPITIGFFAQQRETGQVPWIMAALYTLGLAAVYAVIGTAAALSGGLFGAALQNPWVLGLIVLVLVALALSMFGLWNMQLPAFVTEKLGGGKAGYGGAAIMGGGMGLIAAPCVGPFVVTLLTYVANYAAQPGTATAAAAFVGGGLFFVLGLGLGTPFFLMGLGVASFNPGAWMESVKKIFGFIILGVAMHFGRLALSTGFGWSDAWFPWGVGLLGLALGVFLFLPKATEGSPRLVMPFRVMGVASAAAGILWIVMSLGGTHSDFRPYSNEALAQAKADGRPVVIDFMAEWCTVCKEIEHVTFPAPVVVQAFKEHDYVLLQADLTEDEDPLVQALYKDYRIKGLPTIVFLDKSGTEVEALRLSKFERPAEFALRLGCIDQVDVAAK